MSVPIICVALLGLLSIVLGMVVTVGRGKFNTLFGSSNDPEDKLFHFVRAHSNNAEYAPIIALMIYILSLSAYPAWALWFMVLATVSRFLIALGLVFPATLAKPNPLRFVGAAGTYVFGLGLGVALLVQGLGI